MPWAAPVTAATGLSCWSCWFMRSLSLVPVSVWWTSGGVAGELREGVEEAVHVGAVVVVHQSGAHGSARVADPEGAGRFPGVAMAAPDVDAVVGEVFGDGLR